MKPILLIASTCCLVAALAPAAQAARRCVGPAPGCASSLQKALDAAHDGDTIALGRGTFAGGVTINRSVTLVGSGRKATVIRGGGPVLTIGAFDAPSQPTVTIKGVTITGGVTNSSTQCGPVCGTDYVQATALGGGIEIPPSAGSGPGATVTITDSAVTGNRVMPRLTVPSVRARCPDEPCRFALAGGGGIDNWGAMTLVNARVSDNEVGGPLGSDADGAGILSEGGSLTLRNSVVTGNRAAASAPNGRFAKGGGIFMTSGALTVERSAVSRNSASLSTSFPRGVDMNAHAGGIHVGDAGPTAIHESRINRNSVTVNGLAGQPVGFDAGLLVGESSLELRTSGCATSSSATTWGPRAGRPASRAAAGSGTTSCSSSRP